MRLDGQDKFELIEQECEFGNGQLRIIRAVGTGKMAQVFTTAAFRQFLPIGPFPLNYLRAENSKIPPPIG